MEITEKTSIYSVILLLNQGKITVDDFDTWFKDRLAIEYQNGFNDGQTCAMDQISATLFSNVGKRVVPNNP